MKRPSSRLLLVAALIIPFVLAAHVASPSAQLEGVVTDAATGEPLSGANVILVGSALGAATNTAGRFVIRDIGDGTFDVRVTLAGYSPHIEKDVDFRDGAATELRVSLKPAAADDITVDTERPGTIRGRTTSPVLGGVVSESPAPMSVADGASSSAMRRAAPSSTSSESRVERASPMPPPRPGQQTRAGLLTAGDIDDGLNWGAYLSYARRASTDYNVQSLPELNLDDRVVLRIVDRTGEPVSGARVRISAEGGQRARRLITEAGTDGRLAIFPTYDFGTGARNLRVEVSGPNDSGRRQTQEIDLRRRQGDRVVRIQLNERVAERPRAMDIAFVIDVTGSMSDELSYLTNEFEHIVDRLESRYRGVDLRFGLVAYRDRGDAFVTRRFDFTGSAREMQQRLSGLRANGGGDYPEAMDEALEDMLELDWRTGSTARVAFLVADAPPHDYGTERTLNAVRQARARGLRMYPIAASGVADQAEYIMRAAAVLTQGRHLFLTDDSGVGLSHAEPKIPCYNVTQLDNLVLRVLASELEGRRVEAHQDEIVREVGRSNAGVCEAVPVTMQDPQRPMPRRDDGASPRGELGYE